MGYLANILDFQAVRQPKVAAATFAAPHVGSSDLARLIPGASDSAPSTPISPSILKTIALDILPRFCFRFNAQMLAPAMLDLALITVVFALEARVTGSGPLHSSALWIYLLSFLFFAIEEGLYPAPKSALPEIAAAVRTVACATLCTGLFLTWSHAAGWRIALSASSLCTLGALVAARQLWRRLCRTEASLHNVLIVGSGGKAAQVAAAIRRDPSSFRLVKGYIAENHLRSSYGPAMLSRIAREEFVDELVIASSDPSVVDIAVQEARKNKLDAKIAPDACIPVSTLDFEMLGGQPIFHVHDHKKPEYRLALKRSLDFVLAICSLILLSPLLVLIAALIKRDSSGPVFYRAPRTGRKGREFVCYKFRTMVADAEALKDALRASNEREGAFFKIGNDPRVTQLGRLLRRYSLDELPQLWNVLVGDMSLVGPRPHPIDDVSQYKLQHLQRLDFVPGITGLWQVTARRDPSFERNVALDVEYIKNWNLWLDLRILCKTVSAVLTGSGV